MTVEQRRELTSEFFSALSGPARLKIVRELSNGERSVGELSEVCKIGLVQTSQCLQILRAAGLVEFRRVAQSRLYTLVAAGSTGEHVELTHRPSGVIVSIPLK